MDDARTNKKKISMWCKITLFCLIGGLPVALLIYIFVDRIPERDLAREFILNNKEIQNQFGEVISIKYGGDGSYVSFKNGKKEGEYSFTIKGTLTEGVVRVQWHSEGSGIGFRVERIELIEAKKQPVEIWSYDNK